MSANRVKSIPPVCKVIEERGEYSLNEMELTILMPCLNEAETLEACIKKAKSFLDRYSISGEILIADNGSDDGSQEIARKNGARVVDIPQKGYGSALIGGTEAALGKYVIMGDADDSYDFENLMPFVEKLREGYDLVMGNRFKGGIAPHAMPGLHRYIGNPVLSGLGRLFYRSKIGDFHCGLRGYNRQSMIDLKLQTTGMEFASEMVVKSELNHYKIAEVPTTLSPDGRSRAPHLRSWSDGWRHLKFLLVYSPRWLFLYPGLFLTLIGLIFSIILLFGPLRINDVSFDTTTLLYSAMAIVIGVQIVLFALFTKVYGINTGLLPKCDKTSRRLERFSLENGLVLGIVLFLLGVIFSVFAFIFWGKNSFGDLIPSQILRITISALTLLVLGVQIMFSSFFLYILNIRHK